MSVSPATLSTWLFTLIRTVGSAVDEASGAVSIGGTTPVGGFGEETNEGTSAPAYGVPGLVWRPRPPTDLDGQEVAAEFIGARFGEGVLPLSGRDLRLNKRFPAPKEGTQALVGYGGGFLSFEDLPPLPDGTSQKDGTVQTIYCPYAFSGGTPAKAHAIVLDPKQESVSVIHGDGFAVVLSKDGITMRADGSTWATLAPGKFEVVAATINLRGNVALGSNTLTAVPALPGIAFPGSPSVFFSPT